MPCPNCDHTMQCLAVVDGGRVHWCPRCGTVRHNDIAHQHPDMPDRVYTPKLVERCRKFDADLGDDPTQCSTVALIRRDLKTVGVTESIYLPADRK